MVRAVGIEPTLLAEPDFESGASTNSTTPAMDVSYSQRLAIRKLILGLEMVHSERFEPPTPAFGGQCSIQLSYECAVAALASRPQSRQCLLCRGEFNRLELAEAAARPLRQSGGLQHCDNVDRTKLAERRFVQEALFET